MEREKKRFLRKRHAQMCADSKRKKQQQQEEEIRGKQRRLEPQLIETKTCAFSSSHSLPKHRLFNRFVMSAFGINRSFFSLPCMTYGFFFSYKQK